LGAGHGAVILAPRHAPHGWDVGDSFRCVQMVAAGETPPAVDTFIPLGEADVPEMLELVAATQPGPFRVRTVELGGYIGVRDGGQLVAMAGERMRCPGF